MLKTILYTKVHEGVYIMPLRIQFQVFFSYLCDQRYGDILFEVVSSSIMQKVFAHFATTPFAVHLGKIRNHLH